jgi:hypothetical protein
LLLKKYAEAIENREQSIYPSHRETIACHMDRCRDFKNSNTMADERLERAGIAPPFTGTRNVTGGKYDSETSRKEAFEKSGLAAILTERKVQARDALNKVGDIVLDAMPDWIKPSNRPNSK